jgi:predicted DCC family thiol-disulfide oxidoreductase YuxK
VPIAIYDGNCGYCRRFASALRRYVPVERLDVVPCGSPIQKKLAKSVTDEICLQAFILVDDAGRVLKGGEAAVAAVTMAPRLESFRWMVEGRTGRAMARTLYKGVSALRRRRRCGKCPENTP